MRIRSVFNLLPSFVGYQIDVERIVPNIPNRSIVQFIVFDSHIHFLGLPLSFSPEQAALGLPAWRALPLIISCPIVTLFTSMNLSQFLSPQWHWYLIVFEIWGWI